MILLLAACAHDASPVSTSPTSDPHATAVDALVGVWYGQTLGSPYGDFPSAIAFDRDGDGDVHGRLGAGQGFYIDLRFHRIATRWVLIETGEIPGQPATSVSAPGIGRHQVREPAGHVRPPDELVQ